MSKQWWSIDDEESGKSLRIWAATLEEAIAKSETVDYSLYEEDAQVSPTKHLYPFCND